MAAVLAVPADVYPRRLAQLCLEAAYLLRGRAGLPAHFAGMKALLERWRVLMQPAGCGRTGTVRRATS